MIDLTNVVSVSDLYGNVVQITDEAGNIIWAVQSDKPVILEVEKITSDTYAGETTYTGEEFILLDIYPKTNGTVSVTYGGLTKTITDTSGAESPNAQQVFFGTFNGVSDSVATPASGTLTIEGDCRGFGVGAFKISNKGLTTRVFKIDAVISFGKISEIPDLAFSGDVLTTDSSPKLTSVEIPSSVKRIGYYAFSYCKNLTTVNLTNGLKEIGAYAFIYTPLTKITIPRSVEIIGSNPFEGTSGNNIITIEDGNIAYKIDGNCLVETATKTLISGFNDSDIPSYISKIGSTAFTDRGITSVISPTGVTYIGSGAFNGCASLTEFIVLATTPPVLGSETAVKGDGVSPIVVPKGCGEVYKTAEYWSVYADRIVEVS